MVEEIETAMKGMLAPEIKEVITGQAEIRQVIKVSKVGNIAGCYVTDGFIRRNCGVRLIRDGVVVYEGKLGSLKRFQDDVKEVTSGFECGLSIENFNDIKEGDIVEGLSLIHIYSDVFEAALNLSDERLENAMKFYDYIEIQPLEDYFHLIERGKLQDKDELIKSLQRIVTGAKKLNKIIVATGDVHFLDVKDRIFRDVFISNPTIGIGHKAHPLCDRRNPKAKNPCQYLRTTDAVSYTHLRYANC